MCLTLGRTATKIRQHDGDSGGEIQTERETDRKRERETDRERER